MINVFIKTILEGLKGTVIDKFIYVFQIVWLTFVFFFLFFFNQLLFFLTLTKIFNNIFYDLITFFPAKNCSKSQWGLKRCFPLSKPLFILMSAHLFQYLVQLICTIFLQWNILVQKMHFSLVLFGTKYLVPIQYHNLKNDARTAYGAIFIFNTQFVLFFFK